MHQIYSCSDENIEVFTTVIPSKVSSPARRRVKSSQHLLTKNVVIESELYTPRPLDLLQHHRDCSDGGGRRAGRLQSAQRQGPHQVKIPARPVQHQNSRELQKDRNYSAIVGISEPKSSNLCGNRAYGKSLISPVARISVKTPTILEAATMGSENGAVLKRGPRQLKKITEDYPTLPQGAEASLPLTGNTSCGVPNILRKMWTRHKKKSEYVGATNSAFEAD